MPGLRDIGEFGFIREVGQMLGPAPAEVLVGAGDDCAVLDCGGPEKLLVTTDAALEGRHFRLDWVSPYEAAQRSAVGAISDIAAMGGRPFACLCSMSLPGDLDCEVALQFARGVAETGLRFGAPLIGGDTVGAFERVLLDFVVLGWVKTPWLRSGARAGDLLCVTGPLGGPAAALSLLSHDAALLRQPPFAALLERFVNPTPRVAEARVLAGHHGVHAAIDISDGLLQDVGHMAAASAVGAIIRVADIPCSTVCAAALDALPEPPVWSPATSGEEYELALAVAPDALPDLNAALVGSSLGPLAAVGEFAAGAGVRLVDESGSDLVLGAGGWDHFRPAS